MAKTADYTIKAIANYQKTKERITILFDKGTKDALIKKHGARPISTIIKEIIDADLNDGAKKPPKKSAPASVDLDDPANVFENYKS